MAEEHIPKVSGKLRVSVVTPEATVLEATADFVAVPLFDGELGIAPLHAPMIGRLGFGELRLRDGGTTKRLYVDGGFVQVLNDEVSVLTGRALPASQLDTGVASELLQTAQARPAASEEQLFLRERAVAQARAQLRVAERAGE